jgi:hypothetical protein
MGGRVASILTRVAIVLLLAIAGCGGDGGSTPNVAESEGTVLVQSEKLVAVRDACHVQGVVINGSIRSTFDVTLRWQAFDGTGAVIGTTQTTIPTVVAGEQRPYDATGFASNSKGLVPCSAIVRFERTATLITPH